jgi:hypothetical protein
MMAYNMLLDFMAPAKSFEQTNNIIPENIFNIENISISDINFMESTYGEGQNIPMKIIVKSNINDEKYSTDSESNDTLNDDLDEIEFDDDREIEDDWVFVPYNPEFIHKNDNDEDDWVIVPKSDPVCFTDKEFDKIKCEYEFVNVNY